MSPLELMNDSPCHIQPTVNQINPQSSVPGYSVDRDANRPRQGNFARSVSHVSPFREPILPSLRPADPDSSQLFANKSRWPGYVEDLPKGETADDGLSDFRLPTYDQAFDQYLGQTPPGRKKLQGGGILMISTSANRGVKRKNECSEDNQPKNFLSIEQRERHREGERNRIAILAHGYEQLRSRIPCYYLPCPRSKLSKLQILTLATSYIKDLTDLLAQEGEHGR